ncbi:MAG: UDP-N-acetylmuramate dehydrogenase [Deltaproteobacteria bacterium]|nr:MAG: UDP-N-acetylmuramate dehydrogenase [Deltaproteobacteria bacterium]
MTNDLKQELRHLDSVEINWDATLAAHTSLRVGGPVSCLLSPHDVAGLRLAVQVLSRHNFPYFILGRGTNLVVGDSGVRAAAISLERGFSKLERVGSSGSIMVGAGVRLSRLLRFCLQEELSGLEFVAGIPGSVGGGLRMNAGTNIGAMADVCAAVLLLQTDGSLSRVRRSQLRFSYRKLELPRGAALLEAEFSLKPAARRSMRQQIRALLKTRQQKQPWRLPSAGSVFKNPPDDFAGRLIEAVGLKGIRIGDAQISEKHANFIVNRGQARASEVLALIHLAREKVSERFGIQLELEIQYLGNHINV